MGGKYKAYPEYKDSGINDFPTIPKHWVVGRAKYVTDNLDKFRIPLSAEERGSKQGEYPYYGASGVIDHVDDYLFEGETILYGEDGANLLARSTPLAFLADGKYWVNNHAHILRAKDKLNRYWVRSFNNIDITPLVSGSAQPKFTAEALGNLPVAYPPKVIERVQIANFLDHETAKIDTLIEEQQSLIRLLKEKRQAVISHAVTKGLLSIAGADAPMKDSGVEWLGEVPEHWTCKSYRYSSQIYRGKFGHRPRNDPAFYDGDYPFIQTGDVAQAGKFIKTYKQTLNEKGKEVSQLFPAGTLVMAIAANIGDTAILGFEAYAPDSVVGFKPYQDLELEFLRYSLMAALPALEQTSTQSTQANLNIDRIGAVQAVFPPAEEQKAIIEYLDAMLEHYEQIEAEAKTAIEFMQERRTALISAAVTGKIDVRGWSSN